NIRSDEEIAKLAAQGREPVYLAVATRGEGVVESFIGLLHLTMSHLDAEHDLTGKFGISTQGLLEEVNQKLGMRKPVSEVLSAAVGGALDVLRPVEDEG
ncbi:MAG: gliding motility protein, partial [Myxococcales bacterium]|nr:gliding motility protein [Myxococcales bacterium]